MKKLLETAWVVLKFGWGSASGNHQAGANSVSQVNEVSDMAPTCWFFSGRLRKGTMAPASPSVWEKATPQLLS